MPVSVLEQLVMMAVIKRRFRKADMTRMEQRMWRGHSEKQDERNRVSRDQQADRKEEMVFIFWERGDNSHF